MGRHMVLFRKTDILSTFLKSIHNNSEQQAYQDLASSLATKLNIQKVGVFVVPDHPEGRYVKHGTIWCQQTKKAIDTAPNTPWDQVSLEDFSALKQKIKFNEEEFIFLPQQQICCYYSRIYLFIFASAFLENQQSLLQLLCQTIAGGIPLLFQFTKMQERMQLAQELEVETTQQATRSQLNYSYSDIIGDSDSILEILNYLDQIVQYSDKDDNIYIQGESGTGKSLIAKSIHKYSKRKTAPFIQVNCGALVETLCETEFFGIAPDSGISGAPKKGRSGLLELADKGFIFLDEVAELSRAMQAALLLVMEGAPFRRVCGTKDIYVDIHIISASSQDIKLLDKKQFMPELAERLTGLRINVPPLRQRKQDIPKLVEYFCNKLSAERRNNINPSLKKQLTEYSWPGNIRQLCNCIRQSSLNFIPEYLSLADTPVDNTEDNILEKVKLLLQKNNGLSISEAAEKLGLSRFALRRKLQEYKTEWKELKQEFRNS